MPAAAVIQNPPAQAESKSAKKKKAAKADQRTESPAPHSPDSPATEKPASVGGHDGQDESSENPYVRELQKNIRNLNKKIANTSKTDPIIDQHKGKSLDELVALKVLNNDQKAQRLKKPQLEVQLAGLEEQLAQYKKIDDEYRARAAADKATLEKSLSDKFEKDRAEAVAQVKAETQASINQAINDSLLTLSEFLRLAAARRADEADAGTDENMALEGVLLNVYTGDQNAVEVMRKLIDGSAEKTVSVSGEQLQTTYDRVKTVAKDYMKNVLGSLEFAPEAVQESAASVGTDPTVANAGLTEIDAAGGTSALVNGHTEADPSLVRPANGDISEAAANTAAETQWDATNDLSGSVSQEDWVKVPRDPAETETGLTATPAANANTQSWADEPSEPVTETSAAVPSAPATDANDGFHQVQRNRPRGNEGGFRGGRGRGSFRGRGYGGEGRGRGGGRGRGRGGDPSRGARRQES